MPSSIASRPVQISSKGILFDMDGVLVSSLGSVERSWTKWARLRDVDPKRVLGIIHGRRSIESIRVLRPDLDAEAENEIVEQFEIEDTDGVAVLPGVHDLLSRLPRDRWTVVTSATEPLARVRLNAGGIPVPERMVTAETVAHGKPHPAPYLAGAALLGFDPAHCIVFEDAVSGVEAGRAAGCTVIATTFSHSVASLEAAHYLIPDLTGVEVSVRPDADGLAVRFTPLARGGADQA
jgi:mannitol-1-/sugar-/sorbitol-6-phosphatase